jgi:epoxyqueuosine reductase
MNPLPTECSSNFPNSKSGSPTNSRALDPAELTLDSSELLQRLREAGFDLVGVAAAQAPPHWAAYAQWIGQGKHAEMDYLKRHLELKQHPENLLPGCQSVIAVGLNYYQDNSPSIGHGRIARYALGRDYHRVIPQKLGPVVDWLKREFPQSEARICVDSAPLMERDFAHLAGLGWFGKNTMIINSQRGSWFLLGFILTTVRFVPSNPAIGGCGTCTACVDACPTGAIAYKDGRWQVASQQCISYLTIEHRGPWQTATPHGTDWIFGCDICQEVCPFNQPRESQPLRAQLTTVEDFKRRTPVPPLADILAETEDSWDRWTRGSPIRRAGLDGLKRNAQAAIERI